MCDAMSPCTQPTTTQMLVLWATICGTVALDKEHDKELKNLAPHDAKTGYADCTHGVVIVDNVEMATAHYEKCHQRGSDVAIKVAAVVDDITIGVRVRHPDSGHPPCSFPCF